MGKLARRVQNLPPELFLQIYEKVFTAQTVSRHIDKRYKLPRLLQVNRASRDRFASTYYSNTVFTFKEPKECLKWLMSLTHQHLSSLREIRCLYVYNETTKITRLSWRIRRTHLSRKLQHWIRNDWESALGSLSHIHFQLEVPERTLCGKGTLLDLN